MAKKSKFSMKDRVKKNAKEAKRNEGFGFINLKDGLTEMKIDKAGKYRMDIVPYIVGENKHPDGIEKGDIWYKRPFFIHRNVGVDNRTVVCLKSIGKPCPICKQYSQMKNSVDVDEDDAKALRPSERVLYNIRNKEGEIQLFTTSAYAFQNQLDEEITEDEDDEFASFAELTGGKTLLVRFSEEKLGKTAFFVASRIDFKDRKSIGDDILDETVELSKLLKIYTYEQLEAMLMGDEADIDDDDEEDEEPVSKSKSKSKKKSEPEEAEEDEDDFDDEEPVSKKAKVKSKKKVQPEDDFDDEDEEPAPKAKSKSKKKAEPEEDDFDDFDDFDDDDDEPVSKKSKKKAEPEEDDDDVFDDDDDVFVDDEDDFDDEPAPKKKKGKK